MYAYICWVGGSDSIGCWSRSRAQSAAEPLMEAQNYDFELFELIILSKFDKQFPVEQFEATVSQSTVPSPPLLSYSSRSRAQTAAELRNMM